MIVRLASFRRNPWVVLGTRLALLVTTIVALRWVGRVGPPSVGDSIGTLEQSGSDRVVSALLTVALVWISTGRRSRAPVPVWAATLEVVAVAAFALNPELNVRAALAFGDAGSVSVPYQSYLAIWLAGATYGLVASVSMRRGPKSDASRGMIERVHRRGVA